MKTKNCSTSTFWQKWRKVIILVGCVLIFGWLFFSSKKAPQEKDITEGISVEQEVKEVASIDFGSWAPGSGQSILGTVESIGDIALTAELSGTIESVYVNIGDTVARGQVLARYRRGDDQTFINYQNAVSQREQTKATTQNSIAQAELNVKTAQQELREQIDLQKQTRSQSFEGLKTQLQVSEVRLNETLDYADRMTKATDKFRYEANPLVDQVGNNNSILRQSIKNKVILLRQKQSGLSNVFYSEEDVVYEAQKRYEVLLSLRDLLANIDQLIRQTPETRSFSISNRSSLEQEVEGKKTALNGEIATLKSQIEATKSQTNQYSLSIVQAENRVKTAEANLELAQANAKSSVNAADNSVDLAGASLGDLDVRAPFNGVISGKSVNAYQQVSPGVSLFEIVNKDVAPKVTAFVTKKELNTLLTAEKIQVSVDEKVFEVTSGSMSSTVDPATQKIKVEYDLPSNEDIRVGLLARIKVPVLQSEQNILLPLSSIGFEPDGAEVLVIIDGEAVRRKVTVGDIQSDGIEVTAGIVSGDTIVRYRSRVYPGQKVKVENKQIDVNTDEDV